MAKYLIISQIINLAKEGINKSKSTLPLVLSHFLPALDQTVSSNPLLSCHHQKDKNFQKLVECTGHIMYFARRILASLPHTCLEGSRPAGGALLPPDLTWASCGPILFRESLEFSSSHAYHGQGKLAGERKVAMKSKRV